MCLPRSCTTAFDCEGKVTCEPIREGPPHPARPSPGGGSAAWGVSAPSRVSQRPSWAWAGLARLPLLGCLPELSHPLLSFQDLQDCGVLGSSGYGDWAGRSGHVVEEGKVSGLSRVVSPSPRQEHRSQRGPSLCPPSPCWAEHPSFQIPAPIFPRRKPFSE